MSNVYSVEAQEQINTAENKLGDAIANLKSQIKNEKENEPNVEIIQENEPDVEIAVDTPAPKKEPRRSEFVQTDDPKVQERIDDLYRQVKGSDSRNQMIIEHNRQLEARLAEYAEKVNQMERSTKQANSTKVEEEIGLAIKTAWEEGDFEKAATLNAKLLDLKVEKLKDEKIPQEKVVQRPNPQQQAYEAQLLKDAAYMEIISQERDAKGNLVRGYLFNGHPDNERAVDILEKVRYEFASAGKQANIKTILDVVDERIRGKKPSHAATVLGGGENDAPVRNVIKLTAEEVRVAKLMGIKPEAYARQKQLLNR